MTSTRTARWLGVTLVAGVAITAGCTATSPPGSPGSFGSTGQLRLVSFESCEQAATELRAAAVANLAAWGFSDGRLDLMPGAEAAAANDSGGAPPPAQAQAPVPVPDAAARAAGSSRPDHSGTNVHEAGVDEPDLIKTDGRRIVIVSDGILRVIDAGRGVQTGSLALSDPTPDGLPMRGWQPADLLLDGDRALVLLGSNWWGMPMPVPIELDRGGPAQKRAPRGELIEPAPDPIIGPRILLVDISGPPRVISEYTVDGQLVDARAVGSVARVVVRSSPRLSFPQVDPASTEQQRLAANRAAIEAADIADWLPRYEVREAGGVSDGAVRCDAMSRPAEFSGSSMLTVLTFDLAAGSLGDGMPVSVVADGDTVYSNGSSLYVASDMRWRIMAGGPGADRQPQRTEIFKFDTSQPGQPRFAAAGEVPGWLINQYAMSEWEEHLRVATTSGDLWGPQPDSESALYVLTQRGDELVQTGSVGGLGKTERIYSVRFAGPVGYVVTFRETDPLYTVDLSDPTAPQVLGELKITGYSSYLHPLDEHRLIGVGQEADLSGRTQGTQVSLFDVSNLADPVLLATHHLPDGYSEAEHDPHAFLWWPQEQLLVIPMSMPAWRFGAPGMPANGALLLRVEQDSVHELGLVTHPRQAGMEWSGQIRRSLVIGDTLWTLSELGLQANALSTLHQTAWVRF